MIKFVCFKMIFFLIFISGCGMERKDHGKEYLSGLTFSYSPFREFAEIDQRGKCIYTLETCTGKKIRYVRASEEEISDAKKRYPELVKKGEAFQTAFARSEITILNKIKTCKGDRRGFRINIPKEMPIVPEYFKQHYEEWKWGWEKGSWYNIRRYREWCEKYPNDSDLQRGNNSKGFSFSAPQYDSEWMLFDPGEYKVLNHNLNSSPDRIFVEMTFIVRQKRITAGFTDLINYKGGLWSDLTPNTVRVQRLYKDNLIEAIRIRMWVTDKAL